MLALKVDIVEYISDDQPGFVEVRFKDAWNKEFVVHDKVPIFTTENLDATNTYPQPGVIVCLLVKEFKDKDGRKIMTIDTEKPWGVNTIDELYQFDVLPEQLIGI